MPLKDFEVYQLAIQFLKLADDIAQKLPRGYSDLKDQLKRAALSIVLNIAEGAGKYSSADQRRYYAVARGSAFECYAVVDATKTLSLVQLQHLAEPITVINRIISMLTKLCMKK